MATTQVDAFDELVRTSSHLVGESRYQALVSTIVEQSLDVTRSDTACLYTYQDEEALLVRAYRRGRFDVPETLDRGGELVSFLEDCGEPLILHGRDRPFFSEAFLHEDMHSAAALPLATKRARMGILILNAREPEHYDSGRFRYLDAFLRLAGGMLHNAELYRNLQEQFRRVESLERYQENIFSSMTNLLITTDQEGRIRYLNRSARESLGLNDDMVGSEIKQVFGRKVGKTVHNSLDKAREEASTILGIEGIYRRSEGDMDYSLNVSPLTGKRGRHMGLTLLFTDQTRERALKEEMDVAVEQGRVVKDMFARYLSSDIVQQLTEQPELVRPGGDKKTATVFFADIRGYTSFSEGKDPQYIIEVLNDYFSEAVELVIKNRGYIDKFIGDYIMAAWGVPMQSEQEDAVAAVRCAVEIQQLVASKDRTFFHGKASKLKVGIGMHTGPLVAGNLGSARRMDYSIIGDTVNVAARLEGVAEAGDVIITEDTRTLIGDQFVMKTLKPVKVKGKDKPIPIYRVLKMAS